MILDASFVIDVLGGDGGALQALDALENQRTPEKVSSITVLELYEGIEQSNRPRDEKQQVLEVLDSKVVVPADHEVMRRAGTLSGRLVSRGERIDREDCAIAATAVQEDEPVLTRADHFERISDLDVQTY